MLIPTGPEKDRGNSLLHVSACISGILGYKELFRKGERQAGVMIVRNLCAWCVPTHSGKRVLLVLMRAHSGLCFCCRPESVVSGSFALPR